MTIEPRRREAPAPARSGSLGTPRRLPGLRAHLVALVLAVLLPALAFGAAAAWEALRQQDQAAEARLLDTAQALAAAVDAELGSHIAALGVLAASPDADPVATPVHFYEHAVATAAIFGGWINAYRRDGSQILNTRVPLGTPLPGPGGAPGPGGGGVSIERAFATVAPVVSNVAPGRLSGRPMAFVFVPVVRAGEVRSALGMPLLPERLSGILAGQAPAGEGAVALTDGNGVIVARSRDAERVVGQPRPVREDGLIGTSGVLRGRRLLDGEPIRTAYHELSAAPGWHVWVNEPEASFSAARRAPLLALAGGSVLALGIGLAGAALVTRRLLQPVDALVARAEAVATGNVHPGPAPAAIPAAVAEFERLRLAVAGAEAALRRVQRIGRVGGFAIDLRSGVNRRSAEYMEIQGGAAVPAEERHADWVRRLHPDDRDRAERRFLDAVADGAPDTEYAQEYRVVTPGGEVRWIFARAEIERDAAGRALRMVGAHMDVTALKTAEAALRDREERLRLALEAAHLGAWEVDLRSNIAKRTPRMLEIFGFGPQDETAPYPSWRDRIDPADRERLAAEVAAVRTGRSDGYHVEYRFLRPDGRWIWVEVHARAAGHDPVTGLPTRLIGTGQDITERREAAERQGVLVHELDHRAKNTLAIVQAALRLTPRGDPARYAAAIEGRVNALARAHTLLADARWAGADLRAVAEDALAPFLGSAGPAAGVEGPVVPLSPAAVQALSMAFHELATNAAKYGALSVTAGRLAVRWETTGQTLHLSWSETGGPPLSGPPSGTGFGASLISATVVRQLGGRIEASWRDTGLLWEAWLPLARITPKGGRDAEPAAGGEAAEDLGTTAAPAT